MFERACANDSVCVCVCVYSHARLSFWVRWETAWFLNLCKQAGALLTMPLRANAQNNFQLKIRFSGKSLNSTLITAE